MCRSDQFAGPNCDLFSCGGAGPTLCDSGYCASPNRCVCDPGFELRLGTCSVPKCQRTCLNGGKCAGNYTIRVEGNYCECPPGFGGLDCSQPYCLHACRHGYCSNGQCVCDAGWSMFDCNLPACNVVPFGSICVAPNKYECYPPHYPVTGGCGPIIAGQFLYCKTEYNIGLSTNLGNGYCNHEQIIQCSKNRPSIPFDVWPQPVDPRTNTLQKLPDVTESTYLYPGLCACIPHASLLGGCCPEWFTDSAAQTYDWNNKWSTQGDGHYCYIG
jgi:hypothetical protein